MVIFPESTLCSPLPCDLLYRVPMIIFGDGVKAHYNQGDARKDQRRQSEPECEIVNNSDIYRPRFGALGKANKRQDKTRHQDSHA